MLHFFELSKSEHASPRQSTLSADSLARHCYLLLGPWDWFEENKLAKKGVVVSAL